MTENESAVQIAGRNITVGNGAADALEGFKCAVDQVLTRLSQYRNTHIFGNVPLFNKTADKVEIIFTCRGERDFDLLESDFLEHIEILKFLVGIHRFR